MMKTDKVSVEWKHYHGMLRLTPTLVVQGGMYCVVTHPEQESTAFSTGVAFCSWNDEFDQLKGRKLSLKRALARLNLTKAERTEIWKTFRETYVPKTASRAQFLLQTKSPQHLVIKGHLSELIELMK